MRLSYLFLLVFVLSFINTNAQVVGGSDAKLAKLYNSGKYETCLIKADDLTYNEKTKRDPEPYLYMAMCFYELSKSNDPVLKEDYKKGVRNSIKYTTKFIKKDKDGEMYNDNIEFINMIRGLQLTEIKEYFNEGNYRKAASTTKIYSKLYREKDYVLLYFIGLNEVLSNNLSQGLRDMADSKTEIEAIIKTGNLKVNSEFKLLLSSAILTYSNYLVNDDQLETASENIAFAKKILPNDAVISTQYSIVNKRFKIVNDSIKMENDTLKQSN